MDCIVPGGRKPADRHAPPVSCPSVEITLRVGVVEDLEVERADRREGAAKPVQYVEDAVAAQIEVTVGSGGSVDSRERVPQPRISSPKPAMSSRPFSTRSAPMVSVNPPRAEPSAPSRPAVRSRMEWSTHRRLALGSFRPTNRAVWLNGGLATTWTTRRSKALAHGPLQVRASGSRRNAARAGGSVQTIGVPPRS